MDNATDSRIIDPPALYRTLCCHLQRLTARLVGKIWWCMVCGATCLGSGLLYCHIRIHFDHRVFQDLCRQPLLS